MAKIILSNYDWARLYKSLFSSGIKYYSTFSIEKMNVYENFASVLVPETIDP